MTFSYTSSDEQEFLKNIIKTYLQDGTEHCWLWKGAKNKNGYRYFTNTSNTKFAHRFSIQYFGSIIPERMDVDHICEIRCCVSPKHLQIVTHQENMSFRGNDRTLFHEINYDLPPPKIRCLETILTDTLMGVAYLKDKTPKDVLIEMINIIKKDKTIFDYELDPNDGVNGYKRKWFWALKEISKHSGYDFDDILNPKEKQDEP